MTSLKINAPDGKVLSIDVPEGTDPSKYDSIVDDVMSDYTKSAPKDTEEPSMVGSFARGVMSGIPGAETAVSGLQALSPNKTYEEAHKGLEEAKDKDWETNPWSYGAGKTAGMVGTGVVAPASIPGAVGVGALSGLDAAKNLSEAPAEVAKGAAVGGALGAVGEKVIAPAIEGITSGAASLAKRGLASLGSKTSLPQIESYLNNPEAIRSALNESQLGEKMADVVSDVGKASGHMSLGARSLLSADEAPLSILDLRPVFDGAKQRYLTNGLPATAADELAIKTLDAEYGRLAAITKANGGNLTEDTMQEVIHKLQESVNDNTWGNPDASTAQEAIKGLSGRLNDILKNSNTAYGEAMKPSAELAQLSSDARAHFKLEPDAKKILAPTDATASKISNVMNEAKPEGAQLLERIKGATGQDMTDMITKSQEKGAFEAPGAGGALKTLMAGLGFGAGKMTGVPFGGIAGAAVGRYMAEGMNGGAIAKNILDAYIKGANNYANSEMAPLISKFGPVLVNAAKQGGNQLAATHFVLSTSNPEYQMLVQHTQDNQEGQ